MADSISHRILKRKYKLLLIILLNVNSTNGIKLINQDLTIEKIHMLKKSPSELLEEIIFIS